MPETTVEYTHVLYVNGEEYGKGSFEEVMEMVASHGETYGQVSFQVSLRG